MIHGGHLKDIPKPHKRMFPGKGKRRVSVEVMQWSIVGGTHYYVKIVEEDNPIWDSQSQKWRMAWDDGNGNGQEFQSEQLSYLHQIENYIRQTWTDNFLDETHYLSKRSDPDPISIEELMRERHELEGSRYYYPRDGD